MSEVAPRLDIGDRFSSEELSLVRQMLDSSGWPVGQKGVVHYQLPDEIKRCIALTSGREVDNRLNLLNFPEDLNGRRVLEIGCNIGSLCFEAARRGAEKVIGYDSESSALDIARQFQRLMGVNTKVLSFYGGSEFASLELEKVSRDDILVCFNGSGLLSQDGLLKLMTKFGTVYFEGDEFVPFESYHHNYFRHIEMDYTIGAVTYTRDFGKRLIVKLQRKESFRKWVSVGLNRYRVNKELLNGSMAQVHRVEGDRIVKKYVRRFPSDDLPFIMRQYRNEVHWLKTFNDLGISPKIFHADDETLAFECEDVGEPICEAKSIPNDWKCQLRGILNVMKEYRCKHQDLHPDQVLTDGNRVFIIDFAFAEMFDSGRVIPQVFYDDCIVSQLEFLIEGRLNSGSIRLESCVFIGQEDCVEFLHEIRKYYTVVVGIDYYAGVYNLFRPEYRSFLKPLFADVSPGNKVFSFFGLVSDELSFKGTHLERVRAPFRLRKCIDQVRGGTFRSKVRAFSTNAENGRIYQALTWSPCGVPGNIWEKYESLTVGNG